MKQLENKRLYCDIGFLAFVEPSTLNEIKHFENTGIVGFKAYLVSPFGGLRYFKNENLGKLFQEASVISKPVFIKPEKTNARFMHMSSPFRLDGLDRKQNENLPNSTCFTGAFNEDLDPRSSDEESPVEESASIEIKIVEHDNLEQKILLQTTNIDNLIATEMNTYSHSGSTTFNEISNDGLNGLDTLPVLCFKPHFEKEYAKQKATNNLLPPSSHFNRRPPPIKCEKFIKPFENSDYNIFLSNSPAQ